MTPVPPSASHLTFRHKANWSEMWRSVLRLSGRWRFVLGIAGALFVWTAAFSPWASFAFGYPGKMTLSGFPGGARVYLLPLLLLVSLLFFTLPVGATAGVRAALGLLFIAGYNFIAISWEGDGVDAVAWGAWIALLGSLLLLWAFASFLWEEADGRSLSGQTAGHTAVKLPDPIWQMLLVFGGVPALLICFVYALDVDESSRFVSLICCLGAGSAALSSLGFFNWTSELLARQRTFAVILLLIAALVFPFTQDGNGYWLRVLISVGVFASAAIGLNIVVGLTGLLDLGYIAFFGIGAYVSALLSDADFTTVHVRVPFLLVLLIGATVAGLVGIFVGAPTLRLRGDYLAIVTLGFGEIFRITMNNWNGLTRGPNGIAGISDLEIPSLFGSTPLNFGDAHEVFGVSLPNFANYYFLCIFLFIGMAILFSRLGNSRIGRAWMAIREDEIAASSMGVNPVRFKLLSFALGASMAGAAGTVSAHVTQQVSPDSFTFMESILLLAAVVLGGMGTIPGALLGAGVFYLLPEKLRAFQDVRMLMFGAALIIMMRYRPEGLIPNRRRKAEFREEKSRFSAGFLKGTGELDLMQQNPVQEGGT